jgi:hypothetical protein
MSAWNPDDLSKEFLHRAEQAEARMKDCRRRVAYSPGHKYAYDMALAEFYTFNRLHGRTFLSSPGELIAELRSMKDMDFKRGSSAYDADDFERGRIRTIEELLHRFEPVTN